MERAVVLFPALLAVHGGTVEVNALNTLRGAFQTVLRRALGQLGQWTSRANLAVLGVPRGTRGLNPGDARRSPLHCAVSLAHLCLVRGCAPVSEVGANNAQKTTRSWGWISKAGALPMSRTPRLPHLKFF